MVSPSYARHVQIHCVFLSLLIISATSAFASTHNPSSLMGSDLPNAVGTYYEQSKRRSIQPPAIVYTIAGSDSGGGAGIQADLKAIHTLSGGTCHGCSAITCLTAQNSCGVNSVHAPPIEFLREQLATLESDLYPDAVKIGMLGTKHLAEEVGRWLSEITKPRTGWGDPPFVVVDPVMISTSGYKLIDDDAKKEIIGKVFPYADLVTPNKFEAEELLGRELSTLEDVEEGAREILAMGPKAVLIKGGHPLMEGDDVSIGYAQDYLLTTLEKSLEGKPVEDLPRLCDGSRGVWLRSNRYSTIHTHGTGCTLSSAIATAWAIGKRERIRFHVGQGNDEKIGSLTSMHLVDACCVAKAYVNAGVARGIQIGKGPGPVVHTGFPNSFLNFPTVALSPGTFESPSFRRMRSSQSVSSAKLDHDEAVLGKTLPIVDTVESLDKVTATGEVVDIQLRFKDTSDYTTIVDRIQKAQMLCRSRGVRLWINDHWKAAIDAGGCFGIHLGQEDLASCVDMGGLDQIRSASLALGVSTHSFSELAAALGVHPSYISLGPVFRTSSKDLKFDPQGLDTVRRWRSLIPPEIPLVAIGGIGSPEIARVVREAGADCVAVIGAVMRADDVKLSVKEMNEAMT